MNNNIANFKPIDRNTATEHQSLVIKRAKIHALGMGYTGAGNHPDNTARINISGVKGAGTVTSFVFVFFPVGDTRLVKPYYNSDRTVLTISQTLAALPGWISALTAIPSNEAATVSYYATDDRYEFECLRTLTMK